VYCYGTGRKLSLSLGQYTTIFQAEVYAIKSCAVENLDRNYKNRNIYILSDSQEAIKALDTHQITSKLAWDCYQSLTQLARRNRVQRTWVPGHEGIVRNEMADQLARTGSEHLFTGPEPSCGISVELPSKRSVTEQTETTENIGNPQLDSKRQKDLYHGPLPEKRRICKIKQRRTKMIGRTVYRTLSLKRAPFQIGID
jgi:ribonuclease HI